MLIAVNCWLAKVRVVVASTGIAVIVERVDVLTDVWVVDEVLGGSPFAGELDELDTPLEGLESCVGVTVPCVGVRIVGSVEFSVGVIVP